MVYSLAMALSIHLEVQKQLDAIRAYSELVDGATRCAGLYREAQLPVPQKLRLFLDLDANGNGQTDIPFQLAAPNDSIRGNQKGNEGDRPKYVRLNDPRLNQAQRIPARPNHGDPPPGAESWISLVAKEASPQALTLAVMRKAGRIKMADLNREVAILRGLDGSSAAYNVVIRLRASNEAFETEDGWMLANSSRAGIVQDGILWSPKELLTDADFAAVRREAILLLLKENGPLLTGAITRGLGQCKWMQAPAGRYVAKADLRQLEKEGYVKRLPSGEWEGTGKDWK